MGRICTTGGAADPAVRLAEAQAARRLHRMGEARKPHADRRIQGARRSRVPGAIAPCAANDPRRHHRDARQSRPINSICRCTRARSRDHFVPRGNSPDQNSAIEAFGADVVEFGRDFDEAKHEAFRVAAGGWAALSSPRSIKTSSSALQATRSNCFARWDRWMPYMSESGWGRESRD